MILIRQCNQTAAVSIHTSKICVRVREHDAPAQRRIKLRRKIGCLIAAERREAVRRRRESEIWLSRRQSVIARRHVIERVAAVHVGLPGRAVAQGDGYAAESRRRSGKGALYLSADSKIGARGGKVLIDLVCAEVIKSLVRR